MGKTNKLITEIKVDFYEVIAGWIHFKIKAEKVIFESSFSYVYDPILDLKYWLKALTTNVQQTSFTFNPEGNEIKFDIVRINYEWDLFIISEPDENGKVFIKTAVNRKQLIKALYEGIINLTQSERYNPNEWEVSFYKENLSKNLNIKEDKLLPYLKILKRQELIEVFFEANPMYEVKSFNQEDIDKSRKPIKMVIPKDYDNWDNNTKEKYIVEVLNKEVSGFDGVKLSEFKSELIEKYLYG